MMTAPGSPENSAASTELDSSSSDDVRQLVSPETIRSISPIEGADAIEAATVRGWTVVVKKGEFTIGDDVLYFEIDSALPLADPRFAFLEPRGSKTLVDGTVIHRLKTARLRGVYSQGLVLPAAEFAAEIAAQSLTSPDQTPKSLADLIGVTKYEVPLPAGTDIVGEFPTKLASKTDSERAQNLTDHWATIRAAGPWIATEKVDGTSLTVLKDAEGVLTVCSRNYQVGDGNNPYWNAVHASGLGEHLEPGEVLQAEVVGPGIQGNPLGLAGIRVLVFTFTRSRVEVGRADWPAWITDERVAPLVMPCPIYDLEVPETADQAVAAVDGIKSLVSPGRLAEGVVWHQADGTALRELGGRSTFKVISNKWLLKHDG